MYAGEPPSLNLLLARLERLHHLSAPDRAALQRLPVHHGHVDPDQDIIHAGGKADRCVVILSGMAFGYKVTRDGQRQITSLHVAGELPDLQSLLLGTTDTSLGSLGGCHVAYIPCDALNRLCLQRPTLAAVLWRETLLQAAIVREWLLRTGRRDARGRICHFMCEMVIRHRAAGLTVDNSCNLPLTQVMLADVLGLSTVHVNRVLQELRAEKLIDWYGRRLTVMDWDRLRAIADFDSAYLHLDPGKRAS